MEKLIWRCRLIKKKAPSHDNTMDSSGNIHEHWILFLNVRMGFTNFRDIRRDNPNLDDAPDCRRMGIYCDMGTNNKIKL